MDDRVFGRARDILDSPVGSDFVALNIRLGECFGMEDVSAEVWRILSTPATLDQLCLTLREIYEIDDRTCRSEVESLLGEMIEAGLVEIPTGRER